MTIEDYIKFRIGTIDPFIVFRKIFTKPFTAKSLRKFWWYWNPGYGYFLLFYCYRPLRNLFSHSIALLLTFLICGFSHDILYLVPMIIMDGGKIPLPFVTTWFSFISVGIIFTQHFQINFKNGIQQIRPFIHMGFLAITFAATVLLSSKISM